MALLLRYTEERGIPSEHICGQGEEGEQEEGGEENRWVLCFFWCEQEGFEEGG